MKSTLILLALVAVGLAKFQYPEEWELWKKVTVITLADLPLNIHDYSKCIGCILI